MEHLFRKLWITLLGIVVLTLTSSLAICQPNFSVGVGTVGLGFQIGVDMDYNIYNFEDESVMQSVRLGTGIGLLRAEYTYFIPLESRFVWFKGSSHLETTLGVLFQPYWEQPDRFETYGFGKSLISPIFYCAYRYEPEDGGFIFRIGFGSVYNIGDEKLWYQAVMSYGISIE